jgi:hypothetical protein
VHGRGREIENLVSYGVASVLLLLEDNLGV